MTTSEAKKMQNTYFLRSQFYAARLEIISVTLRNRIVLSQAMIAKLSLKRGRRVPFYVTSCLYLQVNYRASRTPLPACSLEKGP